ncbi:MAG: hypothetical protein KJZ84_23885 [Bryobacteraceae bacterium]|nr:hypothetical protein [Bryobacteraceae bacterium]
MNWKKGLKAAGVAVAGTAGAAAVGGLAGSAEAAAQGLLNPQALAGIAMAGAVGGGIAYWKKRQVPRPPRQAPDCSAERNK